MTILEKQLEEKKRILIGLEKAYEKLLDYKQMKNSELIVLRDNKIMKVKPEDEREYLKKKHK